MQTPDLKVCSAGWVGDIQVVFKFNYHLRLFLYLLSNILIIFSLQNLIFFLQIIQFFLILPIHKVIDEINEMSRGNKIIGTTKKGIGPAYEDKVGRRSIRICDLENKELLKKN